MQVLHDETEADDVLQEVLLQVWNRAESYSARKGKLISWLCTLARRRAIDRLRQHSAYQRATDRYEVSCNHPRTRSLTRPMSSNAMPAGMICAIFSAIIWRRCRPSNSRSFAWLT